jgi:hypothetical protein
MIVTQSTLVGYTIINGTFGIQLAMLVGSLYDYLTFDPILLKLESIEAY